MSDLTSPRFKPPAPKTNALSHDQLAGPSTTLYFKLAAEALQAIKARFGSVAERAKASFLRSRSHELGSTRTLVTYLDKTL